MPWKETCPMDQKVQMIGDWLSGEHSIAELGELYRVSRKTVYKWVERYEAMGLPGVEELSRAPISHSNALSEEIVEMIVGAKLAHLKWGPKKVLAWLKARGATELGQVVQRWPVVSTVGDVLKREGLVKTRRRKHSVPAYPGPLAGCKRPNAVWSADFKGQFRTGDGKLCYPLTITDNCSRYLLVCRGLSHPSLEEAKPWFEWAFRKYGLPDAIRTDNGAPFASVGFGALSRLSIWFIKLGIRPERIKPGHPQENGRHERMHETLKGETAKPAQGNMKLQQRAFDKFVGEYNMERPHEALGFQTPGSVYEPSARRYPLRIPRVEYDALDAVRSVRHNGEIKWQGKLVYLSEALAGEQVALRPTDEPAPRGWKVLFSFQVLGTLDEATHTVVSLPVKSRPRRRKMLPMSPV